MPHTLPTDRFPTKHIIIRSSSSSLIRTWSAWPFVVEIVPPSPHLLPIDCSHRPLHTPLGPFLSDSADVSRWGLRPRQRPRAGVNAAVGPGTRTHPQVRSATKGRRRGPKKSMWAIIMGSLLYLFSSTLTLNKMGLLYTISCRGLAWPFRIIKPTHGLRRESADPTCREPWCSNSGCGGAEGYAQLSSNCLPYSIFLPTGTSRPSILKH